MSEDSQAFIDERRFPVRPSAGLAVFLLSVYALYAAAGWSGVTPFLLGVYFGLMMVDAVAARHRQRADLLESCLASYHSALGKHGFAVLVEYAGLRMAAMEGQEGGAMAQAQWWFEVDGERVTKDTREEAEAEAKKRGVPLVMIRGTSGKGAAAFHEQYRPGAPSKDSEKKLE